MMHHPIGQVADEPSVEFVADADVIRGLRGVAWFKALLCVPYLWLALGHLGFYRLPAAFDPAVSILRLGEPGAREEFALWLLLAVGVLLGLAGQLVWVTRRMGRETILVRSTGLVARRHGRQDLYFPWGVLDKGVAWRWRAPRSSGWLPGWYYVDEHGNALASRPLAGFLTGCDLQPILLERREDLALRERYGSNLLAGVLWVTLLGSLYGLSWSFVQFVSGELADLQSIEFRRGWTLARGAARARVDAYLDTIDHVDGNVLLYLAGAHLLGMAALMFLLMTVCRYAATAVRIEPDGFVLKDMTCVARRHAWADVCAIRLMRVGFGPRLIYPCVEVILDGGRSVRFTVFDRPIASQFQSRWRDILPVTECAVAMRRAWMRARTRTP